MKRPPQVGILGGKDTREPPWRFVLSLRPATVTRTLVTQRVRVVPDRDERGLVLEELERVPWVYCTWRFSMLAATGVQGSPRAMSRLSSDGFSAGGSGLTRY